MDALETWRKKNALAAGYVHFDRKVGLNQAWNYVTDVNKVAKHSFYPFITYDQIFYKVSNKNSTVSVKEKVRQICYAAHIDRCIYQYYAFLLNEKYNVYVDQKGISDSAIAYRTNLHKNNIHFANQAIDFIRRTDCTVIVGDFKGFFDNLDHKHLKNMLCSVLGVERLSADWYAVYKNVTKYATWDLQDILKLNNLITGEDIKSIKQAKEAALSGQTRHARNYVRYLEQKIAELNGYKIKDYAVRAKKLALSKEQFRKNKKRYLKVNRESFGIPQGSPISAVLSNVYMVAFDECLSSFVRTYNGLYLRYSDDFIIVIPKSDGNPEPIKSEKVVKFVNATVDKTDGLYLEPQKTQIYDFKVKDKKVFNVTNAAEQYLSHIDYLGFIFDGEKVTLRPKTVSKYYYRMYRKLRNILKRKKGPTHSRFRGLYKTYTQKGRNGFYDRTERNRTSESGITNLPKKATPKRYKNPYKRGNFLSYVYRADKIFNGRYADKEGAGGTRPYKDPITQSTTRHMLKIRRRRQKAAKERRMDMQ